MPQAEQYLALIRHGQSEANVAVKEQNEGFYYDISGSDRSVALTERGHQQAVLKAKVIARLFPAHRPLETVWVSDFHRVKKTGSLITANLSYQVDTRVDPRLNKRSYGLFWNMTYRGVEHLFPEEYERYKRLGALEYRPPEGENYYDLFERVEGFNSAELLSREGHHLIVGHSAVILAMQRLIGDISDADIVRQYETESVPNGYITLYKRVAGESTWRRTAVSDLLYGDRLVELSR